jgi:hypothetical protein
LVGVVVSYQGWTEEPKGVVLVVVGEVSYQLLSRIKVSICRELASSLETKGRRPLFKRKGKLKECRYLMGTSGVDVVVSNDLERKANGWAQMWIVVMASLCVIVVWLLLLQDYEFGSRRR